ncbi:hypothetical protein AMTRI_Chr04g244530 [Amborella trichopoda]
MSEGGRTVQVSGFPQGTCAEAVKKFLESITGFGTVYHLKIRIHKSKPNSRVFAIVQFTTSKSAEVIYSLAPQPKSLYFGNSYVIVRYMENDIVPNPRVTYHVLESIQLYFGNQISEESFAILWSNTNVKVEFGFGLKKIFFYLAHTGVDYKLDLYYENIWQIQLRRPGTEGTRYLVLQMQGAPRIFQKPLSFSSDIYDSPLFNYYKDFPDEQWVRSIDFTPSCSIGQSSSLCLALPNGTRIPNIRENFAYYKEIGGAFNLKTGSSFSHSLHLVPIVHPPDQIKLPYKILFRVNSLVQNGFLVGPTLDTEFYNLLNGLPSPFVERSLEDISRLTNCCLEPGKWLQEQYKKYRNLPRRPSPAAISLEPGLVYVHRVQVTPSKVYFYGPEVNVSNRVLRQFSNYIDNFLRISFIDEDFGSIRSTDLSKRMASGAEEKHTTVYGRVLSTLKNGIVIGDKKFEFLAFSSSQLRDNSAWMFSPIDGITAANIRQWMGDFSGIRNVAKCAARMGQSFGSSTETLNVKPEEVERISDIKNGKYVFSDGIGKISLEFAKKVALKCGCSEKTPSAFQIRYGGYKGVVAVDPTSRYKLSLRGSMRKYSSNNTKLDVLAYSKFQPCFLNRQVITLLSTLGVQDNVFETKQKDAVSQLDKILVDPESAFEALELMSPGENVNVLKEMLFCGYLPDSEPFLSMMLQTFRGLKLSELKTKTRIFIPNGRSMMGCLDETGILEYGQVFVQFSAIGNRRLHEFGLSKINESGSDQRVRVVVGKVIVAKNPCLHPGDVRILTAIDVPALHHMVNCVVFPQKGKRPHPNECSGSDLDGDIYFVSWDPMLIPCHQGTPMEYEPAPNNDLDHEVTIEEIEEYFTNYMINDSLGIIANAHTVFADKEPMKADSTPCVDLANLFSVAVDFPKTGVPADIPQHLYVKEYPDFMDKTDKPTYQSRRVIGKLFREVKDLPPHTSAITSFTKSVALKSYDLDMEVDGFELYLDDAHWYKSEYDFKLAGLMDHYGIKTEAEIVSGNILSLAKSFTKRRDAEALALAMRSLRKEVRGWFKEKRSVVDEGDYSLDDDVYAKASAWYHITYHPEYWGSYFEEDGRNRAHFISFPWCIYDKLIHIKRHRIGRGRNSRSSSLASTMERTLMLS